jgi:anti-sigma factor RsiW
MADLILASEGELSPMRVRSVRHHIFDCASCQERLMVHAQLAVTTDYLEERRYQERLARFLKRLEDKKERHPRGPAWQFWVVVMAALVVIAGLLVVATAAR